MTDRYDVAVVGLGLFGSAALRRLASRGAHAVGIGPIEPSSWDEHTSVFASHYDSGRITRRIDRSHAWADLASRSIDAYGPLEERTGIHFHHPVGTLWADADGDRIDGIAQVASELDVPCALDKTEATERVYGFRLPAGLAHAYEPAPAGYIDPRRLLAAQLAAASDDGATVVRDAVIAREPSDGAQRIRTLGGEMIEAERVLLATGAYANAYGLTPEPLPMRVKTEVTIVAPVTNDGTLEQQPLPTLIYGLSDSPLSDFYLVPPTEYPDGRYYLKAGADTRSDMILSTREEMNDWMRAGDSERHHGDFRQLLADLLPDLALTDSSMKRCLIAYTSHGLPYIDELGNGLFAVVGGNGRGAKSSDAIGAAAAELVLGGWADPLPREAFGVPEGTGEVPEATPL